MGAIRCEGLTKTYSKFAGLLDLDLSVQEGVVFGFLGPNGAGKTTTVRLLTGLSRPTRGRAWVAGEPVNPHSLSFRGRFGYLPEEPAFYSWMTGAEYLRYVGQVFGLDAKAADRRAGEMLEQVGLREAGRRRIGGYSRGMRQRLGLAQALVNRPQVLFLDEPCSALDPIGRKEVLDLIVRLRGQTTVFMSTHILSDVERVCDQVAIIDHGRLVTSASVEELRGRHAMALFELQFAEPLDGLDQTLAALPWVGRVERQDADGVLRVLARDRDAARRELPGLAVASGLTLLRYEAVTPTLEDVFVSLVGNVQGEGSRP